VDAIPKRWFRGGGGFARLHAFLQDEEYFEDLWSMDGDLKSLIYGTGPDNEDAVIIQCDIVRPPSMVGRSISLWLRGEEIEWLMKLLREEAIRRRSSTIQERTQ
jgi:hypothetical protein